MSKRGCERDSVIKGLPAEGSGVGYETRTQSPKKDCTFSALIGAPPVIFISSERGALPSLTSFPLQYVTAIIHTTAPLTFLYSIQCPVCRGWKRRGITSCLLSGAHVSRPFLELITFVLGSGDILTGKCFAVPREGCDGSSARSILRRLSLPLHRPESIRMEITPLDACAAERIGTVSGALDSRLSCSS